MSGVFDRSTILSLFSLLALYYGAWISQHLVRRVNKGEYLLQPLSADDWRAPLETLTRFHFTYNEWDWQGTPQPQFRPFCHWMKQSLLREHPVMFGIFLPDCEFDDYDHIVPAVGIRYRTKDEYDSEDVLICYDMYSKESIEECLNEHDFGATRESIDQKTDADDGCLPLDVIFFNGFVLIFILFDFLDELWHSHHRYRG